MMNGDSVLASYGDGRPQNALPIVRFRMHPVLNETKSWGEKDSTGTVVKPGEGRPIYDECEYITIQIPGERNEVIDTPISDIHRKRFPREYAAWKSGAAQADSGTPLSAWPAITRAQVEELAYHGIKTVEQLASMSDALSSKFMAFHTLKNKAKDYIEAAKGNAVADSLRSENDGLKSELAALKDAVKDQARILEELRRNKK